MLPASLNERVSFSLYLSLSLSLSLSQFLYLSLSLPLSLFLSLSPSISLSLCLSLFFASLFSLLLTTMRRFNVRYSRTSFNVPQGVNCFDYNPQMNIIATGDVDHMVRLWNPYVKKPVGVSAFSSFTIMYYNCTISGAAYDGYRAVI